MVNIVYGTPGFQAIVAGLMSDWVLEVAAYDDGAEPATWTQVRGITNFTPPQYEKQREDDSDFDSGAWGSQIATGLSWSSEATVKRARASLMEDPGQAILREAGHRILDGGFVHVRLSNRTVPLVGIVGVADASFTENGGSRTDITTAEVSFAGRGGFTDVTIAPVAP